MHSHTAQNGLTRQMEYVTLTFTKRSKRLELLFGFPVPVCRRREVERSSWQNGRCEAAAAVFAFDQPSTLATVTHI